MSERPQMGEPGSFTDLAFDAGVIWAEERFIRVLRDNKALRDSMFTDNTDLVVLYTEDGPIDFKLSKLRSAKDAGN